MENKAKQVIQYYLLCDKLKQIIRKGWLDWNVEAEVVERIAEHIYSTQMLAIGMYQAYGYDLDLFKVIFMLAIHETEEIIIGDKTLFEISKQVKEKIGHDAVHYIFTQILSAPALEQIILEFDERKTKEAKFAYSCDKMDWDLKAKLYGDRKYVNLDHQQNNPVIDDPRVTKWFNKGLTFGEMALKFGQEMYGYDDNFMEVSNYALSNNLADLQDTLENEIKSTFKIDI